MVDGGWGMRVSVVREMGGGKSCQLYGRAVYWKMNTLI